MKEFTVVRVTESLFSPQRGVLLYKGEPWCVTLEDPSNENKKGISCIPEGEYLAKKVFNRSLNNGHVIPITFELLDVQNRSGILIHTGNTQLDTRGCILLGSSFGGMHVPRLKEGLFGKEYYDGSNPIMRKLEPAILSSKATFKRFIDLTSNVDEIKIKIKRA